MKYELWISLHGNLYLVENGIMIADLFEGGSTWMDRQDGLKWKAFRFSTDELLDSWEE